MRPFYWSGVIVCASVTAAYAQMSLTPIGSGAYGISGDGTVACGAVETATDLQIMRWTKATGVQLLGQGSASDISRDGSTIVGQSANRAFRWTSAGGFTGLGTLPGSPFGNIPSPADASGNGSLVVGLAATNTPGVLHAFRWTSTLGMVSLGDLPGGLNFSYARAVSENGNIIVGVSNGPDGDRAVRWAGGATTPTSLGMPAGRSGVTEASNISGNGQVIVGTWSDGISENQAFRWTIAGGYTLLGDLPGGLIDSVAYGTNQDGSVIVGTGNPGFDLPDEAVVWTQAAGMQSLRSILSEGGVDLSAWRSLNLAADVSNDGNVIVGQGILADGSNSGFIAVIPAPSILACMLISFHAPLRRHRRPSTR